MDNTAKKAVIINTKNLTKNQINNEIKTRTPNQDNIKYVLHLESYPFDNLFDITIPDNVITLSIEGGKLTTLAGAMLPDSLIFFNCSRNGITTLQGFDFPKHLVVFNASYNQISNIDTIVFPDSLRDLNLERNAINTITNMNFPPLHSLDLTKSNTTYVNNIVTLVNPKFNSVFYMRFNLIIKLNNDILFNLNEYYNRDQLIFLYSILNLQYGKYYDYQTQILPLI